LDVNIAKVPTYLLRKKVKNMNKNRNTGFLYHCR